jgi:hypothetical protein
MGRTGFGGRMNEPGSVHKVLILPPSLGLLFGKDRPPFRTDAPEQKWKKLPRGYSFQKKEQGRWTGLRTDTPFYRVCVRAAARGATWEHRSRINGFRGRLQWAIVVGSAWRLWNLRRKYGFFPPIRRKPPTPIAPDTGSRSHEPCARP